jgi:hypothetical protein
MNKDKIVNWIKTIDIIGPQPILYTQSKPSFKTFIGGILSFFSLIVIFGMSIYFTILTFARTNFAVVYNEIVDRKTELNLLNNTLMFLMMAENGFPLDSTYISYKVTYKHIVDLNMTEYDFPLVPCSDTNVPPEMMKLVDEKYQLLLGYIWCFPEEVIRDRPLVGVNGQPMDMSYYLVSTVGCLNETLDGVICKSREEQDRAVSSAFQVFAFKDYQMDHSLVNDPGVPYLKSFSYQISPKMFYYNYFRFRNIAYKSDYGFIFADEHLDNYFTMEDNYLSIISNPEQSKFKGALGMSLISMSEKKPYYFRNFGKIQTLLANIGGLFKAIFVMMNFTQQILLKKLFYEYLVNHLFSNASNNEPEKEEKKNFQFLPTVRKLSLSINSFDPIKGDQSSLKNADAFVKEK